VPDPPQRVELPDSFRIRRPTLMRQPTGVHGQLSGQRVQVLGDGPIAAAVRQELATRGALDAAPFDIVVDAGHSVKELFHRAQELDRERPSRWVSITRLGAVHEGDWMLENGLSDGSRAGFTKSIGREWPDTQSTVIDAHPDLAPVEVAHVVCDELLAADHTPEAFYDDDGVRHVVGYEIVARPEGVPGIGDNPVVMITGGARGICAEVAREMARRGPVQLALVGRSEVPTEPLDEAAEKARIRAVLEASGQRVTPRMVSERLAPLRKAEEARQTLVDLRALGADVGYFRADVSRPEYCRRLVADVFRQFGSIDVMIHGAGAEESRLVADKDDEAFHRVYDGKAVGGHALLEAIPAEAFAVSMGSVAGRFGNPGQVDYAAANDALARMCQARPRSLHVDWTAWGDVGMAVRGGMQRLLEERGVDLLPADAGAAVLVDMVAAGVSGEVVVAGRLGDFEPDDGRHPLLDRVEREGDTVRATRELSKDSDPWIIDHSIDGTPVLPGVIGLELMIAAAAELFPGARFTSARNVRFEAPVKVHKDQVTTLIIEAEPARDGEARTRLVSTRTLRTGRVRRTEHYSATVRFAETDPVDSLPSAFLPDEVVPRDGIYRRFFHGPKFQVLETVFGASQDGLLAEGRVDHRGIADGLLSQPLVLESAFQAAGLHRMMVAHEMGLPAEIEELQLLGAAGADEPLSLLVQLADGVYHVDVDGVNGSVLRVRGFHMVDRGPVPPGDRFPEPDGGRPICFPARPIRRGTSTRSVTAEARHGDDVDAWLRPDEQADLARRGTAKRVRDRVAGRMAAKRALAELTGVPPLEMRIHSAPSGEPIASVPGHPNVRVSVSHREGHAVAVAVDSGRVGVDLEAVEERAPSFATTWFSAAERQLLGTDPQRQTVAWCVKEAVLKALGTGMAISPHDVQVTSLGAATADVRLTGAALDHHQELGGGALSIRWATATADEVVVSVRLAA